MTALPVTFSEDQAAAFDTVAELLRGAGVNMDNGLLLPPREAGSGVMAVIGKAGSGKTMLLAELYRALAARGAQVILVPAAFTMQTGRDHWELLLRARAVENLCYIVAPNQYGSCPPKHLSFGRSMIIDP